MNESRVYKYTFNWLFIFIAIFYTTSGFRSLNAVITEPLTLTFIFVVGVLSCYSFPRIKLQKEEVVFVVVALVTSFFLCMTAISDYDKYSGIATYKLLLSLCFFVLAARSAYSKSLMLYANAILLLALGNWIAFLGVRFFNLAPLAYIDFGIVQPRTYAHYLFAATEESTSFISFFSEPSDYVWILGTSFFIFLRQALYIRALIIFSAIFLSASGSIPIFLLCLLIYFICKRQYKITFLYLLVLITAGYFLSQFFLDDNADALYRLILRYFDVEGNFRISRFDNDSLYDFGVDKDFERYTIMPKYILPINILSYSNYLFFLIGRLGFLSAPMAVAICLLFSKLLNKLYKSKEFELLFVIVCFILETLSREAFLYNLLFWFVYGSLRVYLYPDEINEKN